MTIADLWLDLNQGTQINGRAFGYVGTDEEAESGGDYCGWFFTWLDEKPAKLLTQTEIEQIIDSLETDETARHLPAIPHDLAQQRLRETLEKRLA
jgi:hypothetical protein